MRFNISLIFLLACCCGGFAQLRSPDVFLGYELGARFTPHYKIVNYFEHTAAAMPGMMKLEKYGETNEGRPLLLAFISAPDNFSRLEEIRKNNLRLTGLLKDKAGDALQSAEEKAKELWSEASNSETVKEAQEKFMKPHHLFMFARKNNIIQYFTRWADSHVRNGREDKRKPKKTL